MSRRPPPQSSANWHFRRAARDDGKLERRIGSALAAGDQAAAVALTRTRLSSRALKLVAGQEMNRRLPKRRQLDPLALIAMAEQVSAYRQSGHPAIVRSVRKRNGESRPTYNFATPDRIGQTMARIALQPFAALEIQGYQFAALPGRGDRAAIEAVFESIEDGYVWVSEIDIRNCFGSFSQHEVVRSLPIPLGVAEAHVAPLFLRVTGDGVVARQPQGGRTTRRASSLGLPQGGLASSIVAHMLIGRMLQEFSALTPVEGVKVLVWSDNILVMGKTQLQTQTAIRSLCSVIGRHPTGSFTTTETEVRHVEEGFRWLGRRFIKRLDGRSLAVPLPIEMRAFREKILAGIDEVYFLKQARVKFRNWLAGWRAHYRHGWPNCDSWTGSVIMLVAERAGYRVTWDAKGGFEGLVTDTGLDETYPLDADEDYDLSHWKEKVYYYMDIAAWDPDREVTPSIATRLAREATQIDDQPREVR